jgi:hypothetical protein
MAPVVIASFQPLRRRLRLRGVTLEPVADNEMVALAAPDQVRQGLPDYVSLFVAKYGFARCIVAPVAVGACAAWRLLYKMRMNPIENAVVELLALLLTVYQCPSE